MTREEAIARIKDHMEHHGIGEYPHVKLAEALNMALTALRPVNREQVEKVWTGCEKCRDQANWPSWIEKGVVYCPKCGTPLTSWARYADGGPCAHSSPAQQRAADAGGVAGDGWGAGIRCIGNRRAS